MMVLPPAMQWYHTQAGGRFAPLPAWSALCTPPLDHEPMAWIYPSQSETVRRTRDFDGAWQGIVLEIGHRDPAATIFWYDNETYLGTTTGHHQLSVNFTPGAHQLLAIDNLGARLQSQLLVVD
jgi:penicillin-binding protein 1C